MDSQPDEKDARIAELERQLAASQQPAKGLSAAAKQAKADYEKPKGHEAYHSVLITHQGGAELDKPVVKEFDPHQYETSISKLPGFKGEIIHKATKK